MSKEIKQKPNYFYQLRSGLVKLIKMIATPLDTADNEPAETLEQPQVESVSKSASTYHLILKNITTTAPSLIERKKDLEFEWSTQNSKLHIETSIPEMIDSLSDEDEDASKSINLS